MRLVVGEKSSRVATVPALFALVRQAGILGPMTTNHRSAGVDVSAASPRLIRYGISFGFAFLVHFFARNYRIAHIARRVTAWRDQAEVIARVPCALG